HLRAETGLPHWIVVDVAQISIGDTGIATAGLDLSDKGYCLVMHQPQELTEKALQQIDAAVVFSRGYLEQLAPILGSANVDPSVLREMDNRLGEKTPGQAVLVRSTPTVSAQALTVGQECDDS